MLTSQDADFDGEETTKKKRRKNKKGRGKAETRGEEIAPETQAEDESLTVTQKAKNVKKAMEEYNALDHEDMVSLPPKVHLLCRVRGGWI